MTTIKYFTQEDKTDLRKDLDLTNKKITEQDELIQKQQKWISVLEVMVGNYEQQIRNYQNLFIMHT